MTRSTQRPNPTRELLTIMACVYVFGIVAIGWTMTSKPDCSVAPHKALQTSEGVGAYPPGGIAPSFSHAQREPHP